LKQSPPVTYLRTHYQLLIWLVVATAVTFTIGWFIGSEPERSLWYAFGTGIATSLLIELVTGYSSKQFFDETLSRYEHSAHRGGLMHSDHRTVASREQAVEKYFRRGKTAKIITHTAEHYLRNNTIVEMMRDRVRHGSEIQILLHSPIYFLRSRVDKVRGRNHAEYGPRHITSLDLVHHQFGMIGDIERLTRELDGGFEVRYFTVQLHIRSAIWGNDRIFAAPIVRDLEGANIPCMELYPGLLDDVLFKKFERDFDYLWERDDLTLPLDKVKSLYARIVCKFPYEVTDLQQIDDQFVQEIEDEVAKIQDDRRRAMEARRRK
jgi:hypothetical protein